MVSDDGLHARWVVFVPDEGTRERKALRYLLARQIIEARRTPICPSALAKLIGVSRDKIYKDIRTGVIPSDQILKTPAGLRYELRVQPAGALYYIEAMSYDPNE